MDWTLVARIAATGLALVFAAAAVAKLRRLDTTATELAELGLVWPEGLARVIPIVELALAVALIVAPPWGGVAAFAALSAFTTVLIGVIRSGRVLSCSCFGGMSSKPISVRTLVRNGSLLALALVVVAWS